MNRPEGQSLWYQRKELILQPSKAVQHHLFRFRRRHREDGYALIGRAKRGNTFELSARPEQPVLQFLVFYQIPRRIGLLFLRGGVHDRAHNKRPFFRLVKKFQRDMGGQGPCSFIGSVLLSGLAANIAVQISFPLFMGRLIKIRFGTGYDKLNRIENRGFSRAVLPGKKN